MVGARALCKALFFFPAAVDARLEDERKPPSSQHLKNGSKVETPTPTLRISAEDAGASGRQAQAQAYRPRKLIPIPRRGLAPGPSRCPSIVCVFRTSMRSSERGARGGVETLTLKNQDGLVGCGSCGVRRRHGREADAATRAGPKARLGAWARGRRGVRVGERPGRMRIAFPSCLLAMLCRFSHRHRHRRQHRHPSREIVEIRDEHRAGRGQWARPRARN